MFSTTTAADPRPDPDGPPRGRRSANAEGAPGRVRARRLRRSARRAARRTARRPPRIPAYEVPEPQVAGIAESGFESPGFGSPGFESPASPGPDFTGPGPLGGTDPDDGEETVPSPRWHGRIKNRLKGGER